jgi:glycosyltransferase involved in cell wall biosynthesis
MRIGLLHYSGPPIVGGVEQTLYYHAKVLVDYDFQPHLFVGKGGLFDPRIPVEVIPELYSKHPEVLAVKAQLDDGRVDQAFNQLRRSLANQLRNAFADGDIMILHNVLTLHKNLPLTAALWDLIQEGISTSVIGWHHDFAWDREDYRSELQDEFPWDLLRNPWPSVVNVVVSQAQRNRLAKLYEVPRESIHVIPPGIDPATLGHWTQITHKLVSELNLLQADVILLLPARITRRKNIALGLRILAAARSQSNLDIRLLITGPPGPHNPANVAYLQSLLDLKDELGLQEAAHFLYQHNGEGGPGADQLTMANLYGLSDALLFPSVAEGFGIPLLEAGWTRLPIYCSDIPPFHESAGELAHYFSLSDSPEEIAQLISGTLLADSSFNLRRQVRRQFTWDQIVTEKMLPLIEGALDE